MSQADRIQSLDVLRGLAVLGILAVNAAYFAAPWQTGVNPSLPPLAVTGETLWSWYAMHVFFEMKFITLFSMLFGTSVYLVGGERSDKEKGAVLGRRLAWLLLFGVIHATLIWAGDILFTYALCGFIVLFARSWRPRTLLIWGGVLFALSVVLTALSGLAFSAMPEEALAELRAFVWAPEEAELARVIAAMQGGLASATWENTSEWLLFLQFTLIGLVIRTVGVMMIGLALFKMGFLSGRLNANVYWTLAAIGAAALALVAWQAWINYRGGFDFLQMQGPGAIANVALSPLITLLYASVLILMVKANAWRWLTRALAPVGRMAFTNYIAQSLIMTTIFWGGRGFGLFGEVDRATLMMIVPAVWALQLIWSPLWLARFEMGPLEWIWRRLSYGRPVQFVRA
ncbi:MAG: DUF418 domain-containing protein [Hyphomonadaceae bacterium]